MVLARVLKEYDERKNEFLDAAQQLFYTRGYEQTSVNAILEKVGVAKGTFYHYFKSKEALLDSLIERMTGQIIALIEKVVEDAELNAITKLNQVFETSANWKAAHKDLILTLLQSIYNDNNILLRRKMFRRATSRASPLVAKVIRQGLAEGVFDTPYPDEVSEMIFMQSNNLGDKIAELMLGLEDRPDNREAIFRILEVYEDAVERFLGAPQGSIHLADRATLEELLR
ncbi:MAG: TetR/AcrR family transcriptional regulator [Candidatus Marinimicrobia bacterium]|nr:TetR/AcrR family transcriptional regulator [Candidatus Neomarinimicrobiota bacterium]